MSYELSTLPSGLRVASESLPSAETVAVAISVDVGARYETPTQHGISHLLEHMAFKGTTKRSALQIAETFDAIGGHMNAYTSHEHTVYYAKVLKEHLPIAVDVLGDILMNSLFDEQELAREKQVILQELAMHHDTPDDLVFDAFQESCFSQQALGRSILGTAESIQKHPAQAIRDFVKSHYHAPRMVVSAAGHIDHSQLLKLVDEHLPLAASQSHDSFERATYIGGDTRTHKSLEQLQFVMGMPAPTITDERYYVLQILSIILGGGMSSRLFQEVREKRGLVYTIQTFVSCYDDTGVFAIYAATGEKEVNTLIPVVCEQLLAVCQSITEAELQRAKNQQKASLLMARESTSTVAEWIGRHLLQFGDYRHATELSRRIDAITMEDVLALARELFTAPKLTVTALGPCKKMMSFDEINRQMAA